jgi:hypothetical protein
VPSFPRTPFLAVRPTLSSAPDTLSPFSCLTKPITFPHNRKASVASLRRLIGFLRNGDRVPSGMTDRFHRNTQFEDLLGCMLAEPPDR